MARPGCPSIHPRCPSIRCCEILQVQTSSTGQSWSHRPGSLEHGDLEYGDFWSRPLPPSLENMLAAKNFSSTGQSSPHRPGSLDYERNFWRPLAPRPVVGSGQTRCLHPCFQGRPTRWSHRRTDSGIRYGCRDRAVGARRLWDRAPFAPLAPARIFGAECVRTGKASGQEKFGAAALRGKHRTHVRDIAIFGSSTGQSWPSRRARGPRRIPGLGGSLRQG